MPLNTKQINALKPKEKDYKITDGGGLYLLVKTNGAKYWRMKYKLNGKEQLAAFGIYPAVSLAQARAKRDELKSELAKGVHTPKRETKAQQAQRMTFTQFAEKWFTVKESDIADKTKRNIRNRLERHLYPTIGGKDMTAIRRADLIAIADNLNEQGIYAESLKIIQTAWQVFEFAVFHEVIEHNPAQGVTALLKKAETQHRAALPQNEVMAFFQAYLQAGGETVTRLALLLIMLTGTRSHALRHAKWENINFEQKTWFMPSDTMKMKNDFLIPLADWSVELLRELHTHTGHQPYLFPKSQKGGGHKPTLSESTLNRLVQRMGFDGKQQGKSKITIHGFRSLMIDVCAESGLFDRHTLKKALAHEERDKAFATYQRTELLAERHKLAVFYADWLRQRYEQAKQQIQAA